MERSKTEKSITQEEIIKRKRKLKKVVTDTDIINAEHEFGKLFANIKRVPKYKTRFCKHFS